jgi:hypothetical protein
MIWRVVIILLLVGAAALGLSRCERRAFVVHEPPAAEARRNPLLAAGRLLEARGFTVRHLTGSPSLFPLPPTDVLLILDERRAGLNPARIRALYEWVDAGGDLIAVAPTLNDIDAEHEADDARWLRLDPLLYPLGVTARINEQALHAGEDRPFADVLDGAGDLYSRLCLAAADTHMEEDCLRSLCDNPQPPHDTRLYLEDGTRPRFAAFDVHATLWHDALYAPQYGEAQYTAADGPRKSVEWPDGPPPAKQPTTTAGPDTAKSDDLVGMAAHFAPTFSGNADSDIGTQIIQITLGEGRVLALSDLGPWHNTQLHYLDHAWLLTHFAQDHRAVWFVRGVDTDRLPAWLWRHAAPLLIALLVLVTLLIWRQLPRRGALLDDDSATAGDFLDHLLASGRLLWRHGERDALLAGLREQVRSRLARHPEARGADADRQIAVAARLSGLPASDIRSALDNTPQDADDLLQQVGTLQQLRRNL